MKRTAWQWLAISSIALGMIAPALARTRPRYGGTFRVQMRGETFGADARALVAESLTAVDESGRVQPKLAVRWESQNGDRRWQFWLRTGVRFHDGTSVTPTAVVKALTSGDCGTCPWSNVRPTNESVIFENGSAMPQLAARLAASDFAITKNDDQPSATIGTGPFRLISSAGAVVQLAAFDDYWQGRAFVDAVEVASASRHNAQEMTLGTFDVSELAAEQVRRSQQNRLRTLTSRPNR